MLLQVFQGADQQLAFDSLCLCFFHVISFAMFFIFTLQNETEKGKTCEKMLKCKFDKQTRCAALVYWLKYTTCNEQIDETGILAKECCLCLLINMIII